MWWKCEREESRERRRQQVPKLPQGRHLWVYMRDSRLDRLFFRLLLFNSIHFSSMKNGKIKGDIEKCSSLMDGILSPQPSATACLIKKAQRNQICLSVWCLCEITVIWITESQFPDLTTVWHNWPTGHGVKVSTRREKTENSIRKAKPQSGHIAWGWAT